MKNKVIIVSSFWNNPKHVGTYRIERFIRWLGNLNWKIVLINAGLEDDVKDTEWGKLITLKDPFHPKRPYQKKQIEKKSLFSIFRNVISRLIYFAILIPDPTIVWALKIRRNKIVRQEIKNADIIISSSPPESDHITALLISKRTKAKLVIDLRDGWLDEPLKPYLKKYALRRFLERIPEYFVYKSASSIFVTSEEWKNVLTNRIPNTLKRTFVLTNSYPLQLDKLNGMNTEDTGFDGISVFHTGRFTGSSGSRKLSVLLKPIIEASHCFKSKIQIKLRGEFNNEDIAELDRIAVLMNNKNIEILKLDFIPREELFKEMIIADGLLLLSTSDFAIPSKLYEYIPTGKPMLVMCPVNSAVWNICRNLPQAFLFDYTVYNENQPEEDIKIIVDFFRACMDKNYRISIPEEFKDESLCKRFQSEVIRICNA